MGIKITGLDQLERTLKDAQKALASLDGLIATLRFDPADPSSVKSAISEMEQAVDRKVSAYSRNPIVAPLVKAAKDQFRARILEKSRKAT